MKTRPDSQSYSQHHLAADRALALLGLASIARLHLWMAWYGSRVQGLGFRVLGFWGLGFRV